MSGFLSVSPTAFDMESSVPGALVLIYPHETVTSFVDDPASSEDVLGMAAGFFLMIVEDGESEEDEPVTTVTEGQEQSSITAHGTADGDPVTGLLMGYKNDQALGMAITYLLQEDGSRTMAETIMNSVKVDLPRFFFAGEGVPIELDSFYQISATGSQPTQYQLQLESDIPVLLVAHSFRGSDPAQDVLDLQLHDPQGVFMDQLVTGYMGSNGARCDPDTMSGCVAYFNYGYQQPEAISFTTADAGEYAIQVAGMFDSTGVPHSLGAFDMRPDAPMVVDVLSQALNSGEEFDYGIDGTADQPLMAYVRPTGSDAELATLSLALLDAMGEGIKELHNYSSSGDPVFLYWVPRDDGEYTVRLTEVNGQPSSYELTILRDESSGRTQMTQKVPAYADQYDVEITVQENDDLAVSELITLTRFDNKITTLQRTLPLNSIADIADQAVSEGGQPYLESTSGEAGTFQIVEEDGRPAIQWFFAVESDDPLDFQLDYLVRQGIQNNYIETYDWETKAGSILTWQAIPPDRDFAVAHANVRVQLPYDVELHHVHADGVSGEATASIKGFDFQPAVSDELTYTLSRDLDPESAMKITVFFTRPGETATFRPGPTADQQNEPDGEQEVLTLDLVPNWEVGETRELELTKERIDYEEGAIRQEVTAQTPVDLHVAERDENGYVLHWTNGKTEIENPSMAQDPALETLTNLGNGMRVEYDTDNLGILIGVRNWEEIAVLLQESLDVMMGLLEESGMSQLEMQQIREFVAPMFSTKEQIEVFAIEQIQLYHLVHGWGPLEVSSPVSYDVSVPNPFGGDPFPGIGQLELVDVNPDMGQAVFSWTQTLDPVFSRRLLMEAFTDSAATMGSDPPTESDLPDPFSIEGSAEIQVDLDTGWIQSIEHIQKIVVGPTTREDITRIVDVSD